MPEEEQNAKNIKALIESVDQLRNAFEQLEEGVKLHAKLYKAGYDALIETGFTEQQAMQLLMARGSMLL